MGYYIYLYGTLKYMIMKKETLEEAAENYNDDFQIKGGSKAPHIKNQHIMNHFKSGAEWQAERSYSEEDFKEFARNYYREIKLDKSNLLWEVLADKCFEQFKKK